MSQPNTTARKRPFRHDSGPGPGTGDRAKEAHKKRARSQSLGVPLPATLNARPEVPSINLRHRSYYEIVENPDRKKKLEVKEMNRKTPPSGYEFVTIGNPDLTKACKELSREQDAMVFIVTTGSESSALSQQIHRIGHHVRQSIVDQARRLIDSDESADDDRPRRACDVPEPIPETQREIDEQADKAIRDLFPRIPHTDRRTIIEHSFRKGGTIKGYPLVGLAANIPLSRRVQLAVLAHIRHTHTRYDKLLKETTYINARKAVEPLCVDTLVKWRGDEETGRDQVEEFLREVIVISDSEGDDDDDDNDDDDDDNNGEREAGYAQDPAHLRQQPAPVYRQSVDVLQQPWHGGSSGPAIPHAGATVYYAPETRPRPSRRGFRRYQDALAARWEEARARVRLQQEAPAVGQQAPPHRETPAADYRPSPAVVDDGVQVVADPRLAWQAPRADPHQSSRAPPQRIFVRSEEARDYLVPSTEVPPPPPPPGPIFVRALPQRQTFPLHHLRSVSDDRSAQGWGSSGPSHLAPASHHPRPVHGKQWTPVYEGDPQAMGVWPPQPPTSEARNYEYVAQRQPPPTRPPEVRYDAPVSADHWTTTAPSVHLVARQPHTYRDHHDHAMEVDYPTRGPDYPTRVPYQRPQDGPVPPRPPPTNPVYSAYGDMQPRQHAAQHQDQHQQPQYQAEPAPTFVRRVEYGQQHAEDMAMHDAGWRQHAPEWEAPADHGGDDGYSPQPEPDRQVPSSAAFRYPDGTPYYHSGRP